MIYLDMKKEKDLIDDLNKVGLIDKITALAFVFGVITGIVLASLLHRYIVHPLGY